MRRGAPRGATRLVALALAGLAGTATGCGGGGDEPPDARDFAGSWDVQLVVGRVDADPDATVTVAVGDTFRERWVFEGCDEGSCTLRRPDGGLALGDLDDVRFAFVDSGSVDDTPRFTARAPASAVPRLDPELPPGEEDAHGHEPEAEVCTEAPTESWEVTIEVDVRDGVLSGTVVRIPGALRAEVGGTPCFGLDLTLGLSGIPDAVGGDGSTAPAPG